MSKIGQNTLESGRYYKLCPKGQKRAKMNTKVANTVPNAENSEKMAQKCLVGPKIFLI